MMSIDERLKIYSICQIISAVISIAASITILFIIFRSHKKLSVPLHRLLLGLSISDLISSFALSFGSTLSPSDHIGWNSFGNMALCRAQGFLHFFGHGASPLYNCALCAYYLIEIKYTNLQEYLGKIEICLHAMAIIIPLTVSIAVLSIDEFKPNATSCYIVAVQPFECKFDPEVECDVDSQEDIRPLALLWMCLIYIIVPVFMVVSLTIIYREIATQEEHTNQYRFSFSSRGSSSAQRNTIAARNRAAAYSLGWLLSWSTSFIIAVKRIVLGDEEKLSFYLSVVHYILFPLQGLFNFLVFISPDVIKHLRKYKREGVSCCMKRLLLAFRDSVMSRGRSPLLGQASRRTLRASTTTTATPNSTQQGSRLLEPSIQSIPTRQSIETIQKPMNTTNADAEEDLNRQGNGEYFAKDNGKE